MTKINIEGKIVFTSSLHFSYQPQKFMHGGQFICTVLYNASQKHESTLLHTSVIHEKIDWLEILYADYVGLDK